MSFRDGQLNREDSETECDLHYPGESSRAKARASQLQRLADASADRLESLMNPGTRETGLPKNLRFRPVCAQYWAGGCLSQGCEVLRHPGMMPRGLGLPGPECFEHLCTRRKTEFIGMPRLRVAVELVGMVSC